MFTAVLSVLLCVGILLLFYKLLLSKKKYTFTPKEFKKPEKPKEGFSKQIYSSKPGVIPEDLDAIVIGSGIGGLTIAGLLAKQGKKNYC
jgi:all-trans-retinol 13,14-reductase